MHKAALRQLLESMNPYAHPPGTVPRAQLCVPLGQEKLKKKLTEADRLLAAEQALEIAEAKREAEQRLTGGAPSL
jgi:hypothetical protein